MKIDKKDVYLAMLFIAFLAMAGIAKIALQDAGFYCENYCVAKGQEFVFYTQGSCSCATKNYGVNPADFEMNISLIPEN